MGSPPEAWGRAANAENQIATTLTHPFAMSQYEVTQTGWASLGYADLTNDGKVPSGCTQSRCPTGNTSWNTVLGWLNKLSTGMGLPACYDLGACTGAIATGDLACPSAKVLATSIYECKGFRLPTEAEWEYAAKAGTSTAFYAGEITPYDNLFACHDDPVLDGIGWYCQNSNGKSHPVGLKASNAWGLFDIAGNVAEWVNDPLDTSGYGVVARVDPWQLYQPTGGLTVFRGGLANSQASLLRSAGRLGAPANSRGSLIGFRIARTLTQGATLADLPDFTPPPLQDAGVVDASAE